MAKHATNFIPLPVLDQRGKIARLVLTTDKYSSGLTSMAAIEYQYEGGVCFSTQDFRKRLHVDHKARATQKAIDTQHASIFHPAAVEALKAEALAHYGK